MMIRKFFLPVLIIGAVALGVVSPTLSTTDAHAATIEETDTAFDKPAEKVTKDRKPVKDATGGDKSEQLTKEQLEALKTKAKENSPEKSIYAPFEDDIVFSLNPKLPGVEVFTDEEVAEYVKDAELWEATEDRKQSYYILQLSPDTIEEAQYNFQDLHNRVAAELDTPLVTQITDFYWSDSLEEYMTEIEFSEAISDTQILMFADNEEIAKTFQADAISDLGTDSPSDSALLVLLCLCPFAFILLLFVIAID